ncbi:hypothetical protein [Pseudomonas sp. PA15(2017)]|uniref:hypothetical protein n=1 Tax=Pseudomonas sp. PA15(2017) TaxID=1932111 RepID=UPI00117A0B72|nr:hypothetical protein [Pseudomonas sp. PA15(2017)]
MTQRKTASAAVLQACRNYRGYVQQNNALRDEIKALRLALESQRHTMEQARMAAMHLVEACGQGDMLNG